MVFGKQTQGYESNRRHADRVRVENIPRNHNVGFLREDSESNERWTVWTWALQRQDHLHVNVQRHCMESKRKYRKMWIQFIDSCELCSQIPSRSSVFSWGLDQKRNGAEPTLTNPTDLGTKLQRTWWRISQNPVIQYFVPPVFFETGELRSKGHGKKSIHFNGSDENIELLLRTVISANQLSVYATNYPKVLGLRGNVKHLIIWKRWRFLLARLLQKLIPMQSNGETWCKNMSENSNLSKLCFWCGSEACRNRTILHTLLIQKKDNRCNIYAENTRCLEKRRRLVWEDGFARIRESVQSWT